MSDREMVSAEARLCNCGHVFSAHNPAETFQCTEPFCECMEFSDIRTAEQDIVARLREAAVIVSRAHITSPDKPEALYASAADEIERLQRENHALRNLANNLRPGPISEALAGNMAEEYGRAGIPPNDDRVAAIPNAGPLATDLLDRVLSATSLDDKSIRIPVARARWIITALSAAENLSRPAPTKEACKPCRATTADDCYFSEDPPANCKFKRPSVETPAPRGHSDNCKFWDATFKSECDCGLNLRDGMSEETSR